MSRKERDLQGGSRTRSGWWGVGPTEIEERILEGLTGGKTGWECVCTRE